MTAKYELKVRGLLGGEWRDQREFTILNRRLRWKDDEITHDTDPQHVRKLVEGIGLLADSNGLEKPAVKEAVEDVGDPHWNEQLRPEDARRFRAFASRANYLSQDRPTSNTPPRGLVDTWRLLHGPPGKIAAFGSLFVPVLLGGMCPYSAIHVWWPRHQH